MISPVKVYRRQKLIKKYLNQKGKVISWTKIHVAGIDFKNQAPYMVVLVELDNGERQVGQLVDCQKKEVFLGMRVVGVLRKIVVTGEEGVIYYGLKFKPLD